MNHHDKNRKFGRTRKVRKGLMKSLAYALVRDEAITTTEAKAKELRPMIEKLVTKAKRGTLSDRRLIASRIGHDTSAAKLIETIAPQYKERNGGYTRIVKLPIRKNSAAKMALIEFVK